MANWIKNKQYNSQKKKYKGTNNDLQNILPYFTDFQFWFYICGMFSPVMGMCWVQHILLRYADSDYTFGIFKLFL
jgi:hypothetical protein